MSLRHFSAHWQVRGVYILSKLRPNGRTHIHMTTCIPILELCLVFCTRSYLQGEILGHLGLEILDCNDSIVVTCSDVRSGAGARQVLSKVEEVTDSAAKDDSSSPQLPSIFSWRRRDVTTYAHTREETFDLLGPLNHGLKDGLRPTNKLPERGELPFMESLSLKLQGEERRVFMPHESGCG